MPEKVIVHYKTPTLLRHNSVWVFHFPTYQQDALRCLESNTWTPGTVTLFGNGIIYNASTCSVTTADFQTLPELLDRTSTTIEATYFYVPDTIKIMAPLELQAIEKTMPSGTDQLDQIHSQVAIPHRMNENVQLQQDRRATRTVMALVPYPTHRLMHTYCPMLRL